MKKILVGLLVFVLALGAMNAVFAAGRKEMPRAKAAIQKTEQRAPKINGKVKVKRIGNMKGGLDKWVGNLKDEKLTDEEKALKYEIIALSQKLTDETASLRAQLKEQTEAIKTALKSKDMSKEDKKAAVSAAKDKIKAIREQIKAIAQPVKEEITAKAKQLRTLLKADRPVPSPRPTAVPATGSNI